MYTWDSRVRFSEIGEDKRLTLDGILNYFQDSSTFHSEDIGNGMEVVESLKRVWVLSSFFLILSQNASSIFICLSNFSARYFTVAMALV